MLRQGYTPHLCVPTYRPEHQWWHKDCLCFTWKNRKWFGKRLWRWGLPAWGQGSALPLTGCVWESLLFLFEASGFLARRGGDHRPYWEKSKEKVSGHLFLRVFGNEWACWLRRCPAPHNPYNSNSLFTLLAIMVSLTFSLRFLWLLVHVWILMVLPFILLCSYSFKLQ